MLLLIIHRYVEMLCCRNAAAQQSTPSPLFFLLLAIDDGWHNIKTTLAQFSQTVNINITYLSIVHRNTICERDSRMRETRACRHSTCDIHTAISFPVIARMQNYKEILINSWISV